MGKHHADTAVIYHDYSYFWYVCGVLDKALEYNEKAYKIDEEGALTEVDFSVDVTQPQILLKGAGTYELGNTTTRQMGYTTEIVSGKRGEVPEKIRQCQAQVEGL